MLQLDGLLLQLILTIWTHTITRHFTPIYSHAHTHTHTHMHTHYAHAHTHAHTYNVPFLISPRVTLSSEKDTMSLRLELIVSFPPKYSTSPSILSKSKIVGIHRPATKIMMKNNVTM